VTVDGAARLGIDLGGCTVTDSFGGVASLQGTAEVQVTPYPQYFREFASLEPLKKLHAEYERHEAARIERLARIAALHKYLFDFGSTEHVGRSNIEGHQTDYVPVLHTAIWNEERGYASTNPRCKTTTSRGWAAKNWTATGRGTGPRVPIPRPARTV